LIGTWSGLAFLVAFLIAFWLLAGFIPPPAPTLSATDIAAIYQSKMWPIRACAALLLLVAGLIGPWVAVISVQISRIEQGARTLTYTQLISGGAAIVLFILTAFLWGLLAFRPDRSPDLMMLLNDFAWLSLLTPAGPFTVQNIAIGLAILQDKSAEPVFPRWAAYLNFWTGLLFVPGVMCLFFKRGPFAWDGLFVFWIPLLIFGGWFIAMFVLLRQAIKRQQRTQ
jgi:hypothetical protein